MPFSDRPCVCGLSRNFGEPQGHTPISQKQNRAGLLLHPGLPIQYTEHLQNCSFNIWPTLKNVTWFWRRPRTLEKGPFWLRANLQVSHFARLQSDILQVRQLGKPWPHGCNMPLQYGGSQSLWKKYHFSIPQSLHLSISPRYLSVSLYISISLCLPLSLSLYPSKIRQSCWGVLGVHGFGHKRNTLPPLFMGRVLLGSQL